MLHSGESIILGYLNMTIECFVLLLIIMNSRQGLTGRDRDIDDFIKREKDLPQFKDMFKKIMEGGSSTKKVDNFLNENQKGMDFMQEIPSYIDPRTGKVTREDQQSEFLAGMNPDYFGVPESVRNANKFMSRYTKGDYSDPEFIRNFRIIQEFNKKA